ncbi:hypothetical protein VTL71DRAFT_6060 [Oculimacula yallundae]|uniref:Uncharacterized protein n=1 Tax=Oculimacula yallundae TaxID=86028 RepID=A0ABR4BZA3_9HELO
MPPTTPTKSSSSRQSPYSKPSKKSITPIQRPSPPSTPSQKTTSKITSSPPASSPIETTPIPESRPSSPTCAEEYISPFSKPSKPYVINFGRHNGKRLSQVPDSYVQWLHTKIQDGWFAQDRYEDLRAALADDDGLDFEQISGPLLIDWKPPALGFAPSIFHEEVTCAPLWISETDTMQYFKLSRQYLGHLPKVAGGRQGVIGNAKARYYLFHVYDLVESHASKAVADRALESFLRKNEDKTQEIYGMLGLGVGECCW